MITGDSPSATPSATQSDPPSATPSDPPSATPSDPPSATPSDPPSATPSDPQSATPSDPPSATPSDPPSATPSDPPSDPPSATPSETPSATRSATLRTASRIPSNRRQGSLVFPSNDPDPTPATAPVTPTNFLIDDLADKNNLNADANVYYAELLLANGDFYTGQWIGNLPHGTGKYLWTNGCMYEGEWRHGKTMGKGKFLWPSGATYEGEFKSGYMNGSGTYTGSLGGTYRGSWSMNLKHGSGKKVYANGDCYDGEWRSGLQEGQGKYTWKSKHEYSGKWKAGFIHGQGTLSWANGNRFEGGWEYGMPHGNGTFRWKDGSMYIGTWSKEQGSLVQKGQYYPSSTASSPTARDLDEAFSRNLQDCQVFDPESVMLPLKKTLSWTGMETDNSLNNKPVAWRQSKSAGAKARRRRASIDSSSTAGGLPRRPNGHSNSVIGTEGVGNGAQTWDLDAEVKFDPEIVSTVSIASVGGAEGTRELVAGIHVEDAHPRGLRNFVHPRRLPQKERKKPGETVSRGHKNYDLVLNLQLGIKHAAGRFPEPATLDLKASAFESKEKIWTKFPPQGTKHTPPHHSSEFHWKDYSPLVFRTLFKLFKVDPADYMTSICGNDALRELSSPGKSGSFFYLTNDDKYMIKTMKKSEVKVLVRMLSAYYNHVRLFENTLLIKFYGLHCVKFTGTVQKKVRFVVMGNLFSTGCIIHRRFDLKGSSHGRLTDKPESEIDDTITLKDLDLNFIFRLQRTWFQEFRRQVDKDCELLEQEGIMDYSLLVGVYFKELPTSQDTDGFNDSTNKSESASKDQLHDPSRQGTMKLGSNMPSRIQPIERRGDAESLLIGEPTGELYDVILYFGIIDILQDYDITKKLEHAYKSIQYDPTSISAVDPKQYSRRFRDFIYKAFTEDS